LGNKIVKTPQSYEEWLSLPLEHQRQLTSAWNSNDGEGHAFALIAAGRLSLSTPRKVRRAEIGIYHCGEYVLHMDVSSEEHSHCPEFLDQIFEGFRVIWIVDDTVYCGDGND
jgi:hypothetical protein